MNLLGANLIRNRWQSQTLSLSLSVLYQFNGASYHRFYSDCLAGRQRAVHGGIDVQEMVASFHTRHQALFDLIHCLLQGKVGKRVQVLKPRTSMIQAWIERAIPGVLAGEDLNL